jgi:hypothetical protein
MQTVNIDVLIPPFKTFDLLFQLRVLHSYGLGILD